MTTLTSQVPAVTDWLVQACQSSPQLGAATPAVNVFDGPQPPAATQSMESVLWVGANPADLGASAASATQDFPLLDKGRTRGENGTVDLAVQHWSGDTDIKTHRDACAAMVGAVELLLRGLPADGGPGDLTMGGLVYWASVDGPFQWYPRQVAQGALMLVTFSVTYYTRLTTGGS